MMTTTKGTKDIVSIAQKMEYENQQCEFCEKVLKAIETQGIKYGL